MNLLITGAWAEARDHIPALEAMGHRVAFLQQEAESLPCDPGWVEGAVCNGLFLHHPMADFPRLRYLQLTSAGTDRVDVDYVNQKGIALRTARGVYSVPMAEFALCGVLQLYKQAAFFRDNQRQRRWEKHRGLRELCGSTVLILGCGSVGCACARCFAALGCRVVGLDPVSVVHPAFAEVLPLSRLESCLPEADVVVLTLPLTPQTRGMADSRFFSLLKPGSVLVNISRGRVAEEAALVEALRSGRLSGAVLDVFETEPLPADSPLWDLDGVLLTPHNSFVGEGNAARLTRLILSNLEAFAR